MASVRIQGVTKRFGAVTALADVSLDIQDGELMVLLGPSGCGKTTLLRAVAGLESVDDGAIYIGNELVNDAPPHRRNVAMVFQNYALYPNLSVFDNIAFPLRARRLAPREIAERVNATAQRVGVTELLQRKPRQLSGGQRQRVAIARAIVREPQAFLMDEPLSNLDAQLRSRMRSELTRLQRQLRTTTIYVTHDQVEAMTMGDRIAVMNAGRIQQVGTPPELYARPANTFVAGFLGSPPMNLVAATVASRDGRPGLLLAGGGWLPLSSGAPAAPAGTVVVGIRPESLQIGHDRTAFVVGRVELVEYSGSETVIVLSTPGPQGAQEWFVKVIGKPPATTGDLVPLSVAAPDIYLFHPESGALLGTLGDPEEVQSPLWSRQPAP